MQPKLTSRQKQAISTKNKIFDVTIALISDKGFSMVNIEDICRAAEVSVGTFYNYYKSKNEVFYELYTRADQYFKETVNVNLFAESPPESILDFFSYYTLYSEKTGVSTMTQMMNANNKNFSKKGRYMQTLLTELLDKGLRNGQIKSDKSAEELCDFYFIIARGVLFDWCLKDGEYDLKKKMRDCISSFIT